MTAAIRGAILYSNIYITAVAAAMTYRSFLLHGLVPDLGVVALAAACTLAAYSLHSLDGDEVGRDDRNAWNRDHRTWLWACLAVSGLAMLAFVVSMEGILPLLAPAYLLTAYYLLPRLSMFGLRSLRLRGKTTVLALTWTYTTYLLPLLHSDAAPTDPKPAAGLFIECCIVYLVCLFFDHRDARKEEYHTWLVNPLRYMRTMLWLSGIGFAMACGWGLAAGLPSAWLAGKMLIMASLLASSRISLRSDSDAWFNVFLDGCLAADILFLLF